MLLTSMPDLSYTRIRVSLFGHRVQPVRSAPLGVAHRKAGLLHPAFHFLKHNMLCFSPLALTTGECQPNIRLGLSNVKW